MTVRLNVMAGALAFCFLSFEYPARSAEPRVYEIEIDELAFASAPEGLHVSDIIVWRNMDIFRHTASATDGSFDVDLPTGTPRR